MGRSLHRAIAFLKRGNPKRLLPTSWKQISQHFSSLMHTWLPVSGKAGELHISMMSALHNYTCDIWTTQATDDWCIPKRAVSNQIKAGQGAGANSVTQHPFILPARILRTDLYLSL